MRQVFGLACRHLTGLYAQSLDESRRQIQGLEGLAIAAEQRGLAGPSGVDGQTPQVEFRRQRLAMRLRAGLSVVADDVRLAGIVHRPQRVHELGVRQTAEVPIVAREGCALVRRIHVDHVIGGRLRDDVSEVPRRHPGASRQRSRNAEKLQAHGLWSHAGAAIVGALIEPALRAVAHRTLYDSRQKIEQKVRFPGSIELLADAMEERLSVRQLIAPQPLIGRRQAHGTFQDLPPQRHERAIGVVQPEPLGPAVNGGREGNGGGTTEGLDKNSRVGRDVGQDESTDRTLAALVRKRVRHRAPAGRRHGHGVSLVRRRQYQ